MSRLLSAYEKEKAKLEHSDEDNNIDFSDVPELTDAQLQQAKRVRVGRPPLGASARRMISMKIDPGLLKQLKAAAQQQGTGYQTLIHKILEDYIKEHMAA